MSSLPVRGKENPNCIEISLISVELAKLPPSANKGTGSAGSGQEMGDLTVGLSEFLPP